MPASELLPCRQDRNDAVAAAMLWRYWATVFPRARAELRRWRRRAQAIPEPTLRAHARETLRAERANALGAALLALAAPRARRLEVVRLLVALQVLYDYLDTLSEQPAADPLAASSRLHGALLAVLAGAVGSAGERGGGASWYAGYAAGDDGGYLAALVASCSARVAALPALAVVAPAVRRSMVRAAESQSRNHAAMLGALDDAALASWSATQAPPGDALRWWELAAASGSSLALHALLASAADPRLTPARAARLEALYWPWACALNTLLESVADAAADARTGNHCYVARYDSPQDSCERLAAIAARAGVAARALPDATLHLNMLTAMTCFYLDGNGAQAAAVRARVLAPLGGEPPAPLRALRLRRPAG
jgi:tetraprenyl-beta-curcumene synthase